MGVVVDPGRRQRNAHLFEELDHLFRSLPAGDPPMPFEHLGDLIPHPKNRVERGHGLLENHGQLVAPERPHGLFGEREQVRAVEPDFTADNPARR